MKINHNIFYLPPYISTTWNYVSSLHMKGANLMVSLDDGEIIQIPGLSKELIDQIFENHAAYLEHEESLNQATEQLVNSHSSAVTPFFQIMSFGDMGGLPLRFSMSAFDGVNQAMQHNPAQSNMPNIPGDVLQKIANIAKAVAPEDSGQIPQPEPHCNCTFCQIARTISNAIEPASIEEVITPDEEVPSNELTFRQWDIIPKENQLYTVISRLDQNENYNVFLGTPIGCTCGKPNCEHIIAVLMS